MTADTTNRTEELRARVGNGVHAAEEALRKGEEALRKGVEQSRETIQQAWEETTHRAEQAHEYLSRQAQERPATVAAVALGVGVLIGLLLSGGRRD